MIAANLLPLSAAGIFFAWSSLVIVCLTVWVVLTCEIFQGPGQRGVAALLVVVIAPCNEIWLNTINSQFYLAACVAVISISNPSRYIWLRNTTVLLAGLTGVVSCFFLPFYLWRAFWKRTGIWQTAILAACTALHLAVLTRIGVRSVEHHLEYFPEAVLIKSVVLPFFSRVPAVLLGRFALHHLTAPFLFLSFVLIVAFVYLLLRAGSRDCPEIVLLCAMGLWSEFLSFYGAIFSGGAVVTTAVGGRYVFVCNLLIGLALLLLATRSPKATRLRTVARVLLPAMIISGLVDFGLFWRRLTAGPQWTAQVQHWRASPDEGLRVAPEGWPKLQLTPNHPQLSLPPDIYDSVKDGRGVVEMHQ